MIMMELIQGIDSEMIMWIQEHLRCDGATEFFRAVTSLGNAGFIWIVLSLLLLFVKKTRRAGICTAVSLISVFIINNLVLKNIFGRIRPYEVVAGLIPLVDKPMDPSFPSGHTAAAFAAAAAAIFGGATKKIAVPAAVLAVLIAFSRLYLGVHYPSDVFFGAVTGMVTALLCSAAVKRAYRAAEQKDTEASSDPRRGEKDK